MIKKIVIAIPKKNSDNKLYQYLKDNHNVYRGDEVNVAKRMMFAAKKYNAKFLYANQNNKLEHLNQLRVF